MLSEMPLELQNSIKLLIEKKKRYVMDWGIGTELNPEVISFSNSGSIFGRAEMKIGVDSHIEQYENLMHVAALMRAGWHASSIAVGMEGYMALRMDSQKSNASLAERFASNDKTVLECLTVLWHSENGNCAVYSVPFKIGFGREVEFLDEEGRGVVGKIVGPYQDGLRRVFLESTLVERTEEAPEELYVFSVAMIINGRGFDIESPLLEDITDWIKKNKNDNKN